MHMIAYPTIITYLYFNPANQYNFAHDGVVHPELGWRGPYFLTTTPTAPYYNRYLCLKEHHGGAPVPFERDFSHNVVYRLSSVLKAYYGQHAAFAVFPSRDHSYPLFFEYLEEAEQFVRTKNYVTVLQWGGGPTPGWSDGNLFLERVNYDYLWYYVSQITLSQLNPISHCVPFPFKYFNSECFYVQETSTIFPSGCLSTRRRCGNSIVREDLGKWGLHEYSICGRINVNDTCYQVYTIPYKFKVTSPSGLIFNFTLPNHENYRIVSVKGVLKFFDATFYSTLVHYENNNLKLTDALRYDSEKEQYCYYTNFTDYLGRGLLQGYPDPISKVYLKNFILFNSGIELNNNFFSILFSRPVQAFKFNDHLVKFANYTIRGFLIIAWKENFTVMIDVGSTSNSYKLVFNYEDSVMVVLPQSQLVDIQYTDPAIFGLYHYKQDPRKVDFQCVVDPVRWEQDFWFEDLLERLLYKLVDLLVELLELLLKFVLEVVNRFVNDLHMRFHELQSEFYFYENLILFITLYAAHKNFILVLILLLLSFILFGLQREQQVELYELNY